MDIPRRRYPAYFELAVLFLFAGFLPAHSRSIPKPVPNTDRGTAMLRWQTPARWRHGLFRKTSGVLAINESGLAFRPTRGSPLLWSFEQIQTFDLSPHSLVVIGYQNRHWPFHGEREFRFDLESAIPPDVAAALARGIGKPSKNGVPNPDAAAMAAIPARHRTLLGGTNGTLRFQEAGMDYVTLSGRGARSWRWADIETVALADRYHFSVYAYRETFVFELKQAMSQKLFDWLWNQVYGHGLAGLSTENGASQ